VDQQDPLPVGDGLAPNLIGRKVVDRSQNRPGLSLENLNCRLGPVSWVSVEKCKPKEHKMSVALTWHAPHPQEVGDDKWELRGPVSR
jgi:hypothetical protein